MHKMGVFTPKVESFPINWGVFRLERGGIIGNSELS
jgi:hypothetical protein